MKIQEWVERHRHDGHHPHAAPTKENPERWDCDCGTIWRILTMEQLRQKFAHLKHNRRLADPDFHLGSGSAPWINGERRGR